MNARMIFPVVTNRTIGINLVGDVSVIITLAVFPCFVSTCFNDDFGRQRYKNQMYYILTAPAGRKVCRKRCHPINKPQRGERCIPKLMSMDQRYECAYGIPRGYKPHH